MSELDEIHYETASIRNNFPSSRGKFLVPCIALLLEARLRQQANKPTSHRLSFSVTRVVLVTSYAHRWPPSPYIGCGHHLLVAVARTPLKLICLLSVVFQPWTNYCCSLFWARTDPSRTSISSLPASPQDACRTRLNKVHELCPPQSAKAKSFPRLGDSIRRSYKIYRRTPKVVNRCENRGQNFQEW